MRRIICAQRMCSPTSSYTSTCRKDSFWSLGAHSRSCNLLNQMYGCADGYIIFGFMENESDCYICDDFLEEYKILSFHSEIVRCHAGQFIYGIRCSLNKQTGQATIKDEKRAIVEAAYAAACKVNGDSKYSGLGYFIAVTMDDTELCHTEYDPRKKATKASAKKSWVNEDNEDGEGEDFAIETRTQQAAKKQNAATSQSTAQPVAASKRKAVTRKSEKPTTTKKAKK